MFYLPRYSGFSDLRHHPTIRVPGIPKIQKTVGISACDFITQLPIEQWQRRISCQEGKKTSYQSQSSWTGSWSSTSWLPQHIITGPGQQSSTATTQLPYQNTATNKSKPAKTKNCLGRPEFEEQAAMSEYILEQISQSPEEVTMWGYNHSHPILSGD